MPVWLKRAGLALLGVAVAVGAAWLAFVLGRRKAADDLKAEHEVRKATVEIDAINAQQSKLIDAQKKLQQSRLNVVTKIRAAEATLAQREAAIEERYK